GNLPLNDHLLDLSYGNGQWLGITANGYVMSSADLSHWQVLGSPFPRVLSTVFFCPPTFNKLEFVHGLWVAVARPCTGTGVFSISTSIDGVKWMERYRGQEIRDIAFGDGRLMAVDRIGSVLESDPFFSLEMKRPDEILVRKASGIPV